MRRFSLALLLTILTANSALTLSAQEAKKDAPKAAAPAAAPATAPAAAPAAAPATAPAAAEPKKVVEAPLKPITPEVEAKLEAARKAVAELVVAAEDAGLVETSINQPPILDLLITGRATDLRELKKAAADRIGVSPEVFCAWFTGQGKAKDALGGLEIKPQNDVRIIQPAKGLSDWYEKRANILNTYVAQARSTKAAETAKKVEEAKAAEAAAKKAAEPKKAEAPKAEVKKEEPKKAEAPKAEVKKEEPKKAEAPKAEVKKEEPKKK